MNSLLSVLTINDVKEELGIDTIDEAIDNRITRYIKIADSYLKGAISENYDADDERAKGLALLIIEDLYDRKSFNIKENKVIEKMKNDFILQLQLESKNGIK